MKNIFLNGFGAVLLAVSLQFMQGCSHRKNDTMQAPPPPAVKVAESISKDVVIYIDSFGVLSATETVNIQPQVSGKLVSASFTEGDHVNKGTFLFLIETNEYHAALMETNAQLEGDKAELKKKQATLERNLKLFKQELISKENFEDYQTAVEAAEAQVEFDKAKIEQAAINLRYCTIKSPVSGITGKKLVDPGNIVTPSGQCTLVNIRKYNPLYIDFTVPEDELQQIAKAQRKKGLQVIIAVPSITNKTFSGTLSFIDNTVNGDSGNISLRAIIPNPSRELWPGQFVHVRVITGTKKKAVLVPDATVQMGKDGPYVFAVKQDNTVTIKLVSQGAHYGDYIVITHGLEQGETVVTSGQLGLYESATIRPQQTDEYVVPSGVDFGMSESHISGEAQGGSAASANAVSN